MSTEYRRGIPSTAHVEAATRLGLLWLGSDMWLHRFRNQNGRIEVCYFEDPNETSYWEVPDFGIEDLDFRPIRPDGTPVDWEVLDQEVVRVGQPGQPPGFRADLWRRMCQNFLDRDECELSLSMVEEFDGNEFFRFSNGNCLAITQDSRPGYTRADVLARWTVYQELKPLYDLVDGAQGEAAMPRDVVSEWSRLARGGEIRLDWELVRTPEGLLARSTNGSGNVVWRDDEGWLGQILRNFAAVLDAVAERRVAERQASRGQTLREQLAELPQAVQAERTANEARRFEMEARLQPGPLAQPAQPEPRRFADVRPDRHAHKHWRIFGDGCGTGGTAIIVSDNGTHWDALAVDNRTWSEWDTSSQLWLTRTVIPTDEQGNPVSWEAAGFAAEAMRGAQESVQRAANDATPARSVGDIEWTVTGLPVTRHMTIDPATGVVRSTLPLPLPRFTADELDDVDHSKTTKLDEVTLRRGKLPTVEQIAKYREVRARRTGGTVADALKESRIDCEVAQYVLERWAGGLGDANVLAVIEEVRFLDCAVDVDKRAAWFIGLTCGATLDTSEKPSPIVQRERQEADERRQRLAELRQRLATERLAQPQEMAKENVSRFDLIEPDPQADPTASIRAWEARQAAAKVRPVSAPPRIAKPARQPRRFAIEVVDAEADGLTRGDIVAALAGRAFNAGC